MVVFKKNEQDCKHIIKSHNLENVEIVTTYFECFKKWFMLQKHGDYIDFVGVKDAGMRELPNILLTIQKAAEAKEHEPKTDSCKEALKNRSENLWRQYMSQWKTKDV